MTIMPASFLRTALVGAVLCVSTVLYAQAPQKIWAYAIGDWRNGPVVTISPLFETTEAFTTPMLIAKVKKDYPQFKNITDIDVLRFATVEEGELNRITLKGKYEARKLDVNFMQEAPPTEEQKQE
jgi:hypothetical protein